MSQYSKRIGEVIEEISEKKKGSLRFPVMSGTVVPGSVDDSKQTCSVQLSTDDEDDDVHTKGIVLNAVSSNNNGMILYPADGSNVLVAEIDGPGKWGLIKCSNLVKLNVKIGDTTFTITDGKIQMNGGSNGGLTITPKLVAALNRNNALLTHLIAIISGPPIPEPGLGAPSALQTALAAAIATDTLGDFSSIEDKNVTH